MDLGPHAFFIISAYVAAAVILAGLILRAVLDHRAQARALAELEGRGARRRSSGVEHALLSSPASPHGQGPRTIAGKRTA